MDTLAWLILIILFFMILSAKSDIRRLEWQLEQLSKPKPKPQPQTPDEAEPPVVQAAACRQSLPNKPEIPLAELPSAEKLPVEPKPAAAPQPQSENGITFLGQKLITWIAGFAAVLGFFYFVRYSIENGLIGPVARLSLAAAGGLLSVAAGCWLHFHHKIANHQRIGEALTGAGIAALYFSAYALSKIYALAPVSVSFALMCLVTGGAILLTLSCGGVAAATLALTGGFLTPALTAGVNSGIGGFSFYLLVLCMSLLFVSRRIGSVFLGLLVLSGLYVWVFIWTLLYFAPGDSVWLVLLTALTAFANVDLSDDKEDNRGNFLLQALSLVFCLIFTFSFLLKTDFGLLEWQLLALLTTALTILTFFRRQTYLPLLAATQAVIFILLATWYTPDTAQKQLIFAGFAALTLLPFYIAVWIRPCKEFIVWLLTAAPLIYELATFIFYDPDGLSYIGLAAAAALALQTVRFKWGSEPDNRLIGLLLLASAALTTMALASLAKFDLWPAVLAIEILILGALSHLTKIKNLTVGVKIGGFLFALVQLKNILFALGVILFAPRETLVTKFYFHASDLTARFYASYIIIPALAFAALAWIGKDKCRRTAAAAAAALSLAGIFSFYMLMRMKFAGLSQLAPDFVDGALITNLLLLGGFGLFSSRWQGIGKLTFALGLWRLIGLSLVLHSPFFSRIDISAAGILFAYGVPMVLFAVYAWKSSAAARKQYTLATAAMSFIVVSALLSFALYGSVDLFGIRFDNSGIFAYSAAWLVLGCCWLLAAFRNTALVKPAFGLIYFVIAKVFLYDVSSLDGIWRISALFGLAVSLLAISYFYSRFFQPRRDATAESQTPA